MRIRAGMRALSPLVAPELQQRVRVLDRLAPGDDEFEREVPCGGTIATIVATYKRTFMYEGGGGARAEPVVALRVEMPAPIAEEEEEEEEEGGEGERTV